MGLLRSVADAVLVGSGTLHGDPGHVRIPAFIYPEAKELYAELRRKLGKPSLIMTVRGVGFVVADDADRGRRTADGWRRTAG